MANNEYEKGYYQPKYPEKYKGKSNPYYKSSYEWRTMYWLDTNKKVIEWTYEPYSIPYVYTVPENSPLWMQNLVDHKTHQYHIDFVAKIQLNNGKIQTFFLEIKPYSQTIMPAEPKKKTKKSLTKFCGYMKEYIKNDCKWKAAKEYCDKRGYTFTVLTEKQIFS